MAGVPGPLEVPTDPAGAGEAFARLVVVMDILRSPGGCPWDGEQTHASLAPYAIEEAYEVADAAERGDLDHLREELGDLLLQVVFHARLAAEDAERPFDAGDVVRGLVDKLMRRHPHVFGDVTATGTAEVVRRWEAIKEAERPRSSVLEGVPEAMPALARAQKAVARSRAAGRPLRPAHPAGDIGERLLDLVVEAEEGGLDAEAALRAALRRHVRKPAADAYGA